MYRWHIGVNDPDWSQIVVMDALVSLPFVEVLRISLGGAPTTSFRLEQLTNMRRITISGYCADARTEFVAGLRTLISNSPRLTHLDVSVKGRADGADVATLHDLLGDVPAGAPLALTHLTLQNWGVRLDARVIPSLRSLHTLSLHNAMDARGVAASDDDDAEMAELVTRTAACCSSSDEIWDALRADRIWLTEIATDAVSGAFLDYLAAYTGVKRLTLSSAIANDGLVSDALAIRFYTDVLPQHAASLVALEVTPEYEGKWCFGRHNSASLLRCVSLQTLKIHINSGEINRAKKQDVVVSPAPPSFFASLLTRSLLLQWTLLEIADALPHLSHLTIASADSESNRGGRSGNPSIGHIYRVNKEITESVTTFGPLEPSAMSKVITTPVRDYVARSDKNAGSGLWYRSSMSQGSHLEL